MFSIYRSKNHSFSEYMYLYNSSDNINIDFIEKEETLKQYDHVMNVLDNDVFLNFSVLFKTLLTTPNNTNELPEYSTERELQNNLNTFILNNVVLYNDIKSTSLLKSDREMRQDYYCQDNNNIFHLNIMFLNAENIFKVAKIKNKISNDYLDYDYNHEKYYLTVASDFTKDEQTNFNSFNGNIIFKHKFVNDFKKVLNLQLKKIYYTKESRIENNILYTNAQIFFRCSDFNIDITKYTTIQDLYKDNIQFINDLYIKYKNKAFNDFKKYLSTVIQERINEYTKKLEFFNNFSF